MHSVLALRLLLARKHGPRLLRVDCHIRGLGRCGHAPSRSLLQRSIPHRLAIGPDRNARRCNSRTLLLLLLGPRLSDRSQPRRLLSPRFDSSLERVREAGGVGLSSGIFGRARGSLSTDSYSTCLRLRPGTLSRKLRRYGFCGGLSRHRRCRCRRCCSLLVRLVAGRLLRCLL